MRKRNTSWKRIHNLPDLQPGHSERHKLNKQIKESAHFQKACEAAEVEPTLRQARKFRNKAGAAWAHRDIQGGA